VRLTLIATRPDGPDREVVAGPRRYKRFMIFRTIALGLAAASLTTASARLSLAAPSRARANVGPQRLLTLSHAAIARSAPSPGASAIRRVARWTPLTQSPTVLPIIGEADGPAGGKWLLVNLPSRPNGIAGWVRADAGGITETPWMVVIRRAERRALVLRAGRVEARFPVVVGKRSTPTPLGRFFVTGKLLIAR
jgi:L,D-transpeptidase catalytic domain